MDRLADAVGTEAEIAELMKVLHYKEELQIATTNMAVNGAGRGRNLKVAATDTRCLPLRDDGDDFGRVEARIPKKLFFSLMKQRNFGYEGFTSDEGMRDFKKAYPQFAVETVSGKTVVGWEGEGKAKGRRLKAKVNFGPGTMEFAK